MGRKEQVAKFYKQNLTQKQIAKKLGISHQAIYQIEKRLGLSRRKENLISVNCRACGKELIRSKKKASRSFCCDIKCKKLFALQKKIVTLEKNKSFCYYCKKKSRKLHKLNNWYYCCRRCNRIRLKIYGKTLSGKKARNRASKKAIKKYPEKQNARYKVRDALLLGHLVKPIICEKCKCKKKVQAHHEDYTKPLKVNWLCSGCHADIHKKL